MFDADIIAVEIRNGACRGEVWDACPTPHLGYLVDCGEVEMRRKFASTLLFGGLRGSGDAEEIRINLFPCIHLGKGAYGIDAVITAAYILVLMMPGKHGAESPVEEIAGLQLSFIEIRELQPWPRMFTAV